MTDLSEDAASSHVWIADPVVGRQRARIDAVMQR